MQTLF